MNLFEISIIDERKIPCYVGTTIETRAEKQAKIEFRGENFQAKIYQQNPKIDYSEYEKILKQIKNSKI